MGVRVFEIVYDFRLVAGLVDPIEKERLELSSDFFCVCPSGRILLLGMQDVLGSPIMFLDEVNGIGHLPKFVVES